MTGYLLYGAVVVTVALWLLLYRAGAATRRILHERIAGLLEVLDLVREQRDTAWAALAARGEPSEADVYVPDPGEWEALTLLICDTASCAGERLHLVRPGGATTCTGCRHENPSPRPR